ncbi:MAG: ATP-binding protein, partial [Dehalococcoidales bacterium]|nr:ATP-binding protein [Dehalococcoidales bacterium]
KQPFAKFIEANVGDGVLVVCGLPGSWKTETCEEVARIKGFPILRTDLIRLNVLKGQDVFDEKVAANMDKRVAVYEEMFRQAEQVLSREKGVILDATFVTQELRKRAANIAARHKLAFTIMQTDCPQEVSIRRILARTKENYESNALDEKAYLNNKKNFDKVDITDIRQSCPNLKITHFIVDTRADPPDGWYVTGVEKC